MKYNNVLKTEPVINHSIVYWSNH